MEIRYKSVEQYKNSRHKWKKELKDLKKQSKILYSITKKFGSRHELKKIKNIKAKVSKKRYDSRSDSSSDEYYYESSLSRNSD